ncbi:DUF2786 domain-containing protein [Pseudomonas veronii subsp. inensis]|uniref:DUF2786 domain-containing protein n=1 Tax=Pseudomonas veronii TaxID=76761 RepID=UPI0031F77B87
MSMESKSFSRERALEKIKKCLALAESTNPNEAESALRQARKLMEKYQLEMSDVDSSRADEYVHQVGKATRQSAQWVRMLGVVVAESMGCICFFRSGTKGQALIFIGSVGSGELAAYAYDVLSRQLLSMKKHYLESLPNHGKAYKRKMGTLYSEGWIAGIGKRVQQFAGMDEQTDKAVTAFCEKHYPDVSISDFKRRKVSSDEYEASLAGQDDGGKVSLHRPMGREEQALLDLQ